jgi:hypothetical protein
VRLDSQIASPFEADKALRDKTLQDFAWTAPLRTIRGLGQPGLIQIESLGDILTTANDLANHPRVERFELDGTFYGDECSLCSIDGIEQPALDKIAVDQVWRENGDQQATNGSANVVVAVMDT